MACKEAIDSNTLYNKFEYDGAETLELSQKPRKEQARDSSGASFGPSSKR